MGRSALPVIGAPALLLGKTLVLADLHLGYETEYWNAGVRLPSQVDRFISELRGLLERVKPRKIVVAGDIKHNVPEIRKFEEEAVRKIALFLEEYAKTVFLKGNHDGDLEDILPDSDVRKQIRIGKTLIFHGHAWPELKNEKLLIMAHIHPAVELKSKLGTKKEKAWVFTETTEKFEERFGFRAKLIVLPAFSFLFTGSNILQLESWLGPLPRNGMVEIENAEVFLLDGTFLGKIGELRRLVGEENVQNSFSGSNRS